MEINILYKAESLDDFSLQLKKVIQYFDAKIFKKPAKVSILKSKSFLEKGAAASSTKKWFFKLLGLPDDYFIFRESKHLENLSKLEFGAICCGLHEVRHRFQHYNNGCLISPAFTRRNTEYFSKKMIDYLYQNTYSRYGEDRKTFEREFDASLLESIVSLNCRNNKMTTEIVMELITCNQENIESIMLKLL